MLRAMAEADPPRRPTSPWRFLVLLVPVGATSGYVAVALPYLLDEAGLPMERIGALSALTFLPHSWKFLWTPLLDVGLRRKHWHLLMSLIAALGTALCFFLSPRAHFGLLSVLLLVVNVASATSHNALGSLCATTVHPARKGLASGCFSAGQLAAMGLVGGLMLILYRPPPLLQALHMPPLPLPAIGVLAGLLMLATTLPVLAIDEAPPPRLPAWPLFRGVLRDAWSTARSRAGWTGLLICLSPVGTAAAANLFSALGGDYHASAADVALAAGLYASLANALGSLLGGYLADRMNRRAAYLLGGAATAACALGLALSPARPQPYVIWTVAYAVASGVCYATFYAFVFEMIGPSAGATTTYGLFAGAANLAIAYVTYLDGRMYRHGGRVGLLLCDALLSVLGIMFLLGLRRLISRRSP
jgi:MFS family permease